MGTSTGCHSWQTAASLATCLESRQAEARGGWQLTVEMSVAYPLTHPDRHCKGQTVNRASPSNSNDAKQQAKGVWCHRPSPEVEVEGSESQGHSQPLSMFEASLGYKKESLSQKKKGTPPGKSVMLPGRSVVSRTFLSNTIPSLYSYLSGEEAIETSFPPGSIQFAVGSSHIYPWLNTNGLA